MAGTMFLMRITFPQQGSSNGSSSRLEKDIKFFNPIQCRAFDYEIETQARLPVGAAFGNRQHRPLHLAKSTRSAGPSLLQNCPTPLQDVPDERISRPLASYPGKRPYHPITVIKEVTEASSRLLQAAGSRPPFSSVRLDFDHPPSPSRRLLAIRTIEMVDGFIVELHPVPSVHDKPCEKITFVFNHLLLNGSRQLFIPRSA
jgi:type VI protein secretion system component Hcp